MIADDRGTLAEQLSRRGPVEPRPLRFVPTRAPRPETGAPIDPALTRRDLILANGLGGFTPDGREYVIALRPAR